MKTKEKNTYFFWDTWVYKIMMLNAYELMKEWNINLDDSNIWSPFKMSS